MSDYDSFRENQMRIHRDQHAEMFCRLEITRANLRFWRLLAIGMALAFLIVVFLR